MPKDNLYKPQIPKADPRRHSKACIQLLEKHVREALLLRKSDIDDKTYTVSEYHTIQDRGLNAASKLLSIIQSGKLNDLGWDRKCDRLQKFLEEFLDLEPADFARRVIEERARMVIQDGGIRLAWRLYEQHRRAAGKTTDRETTEAILNKSVRGKAVSLD